MVLLLLLKEIKTDAHAFEKGSCFIYRGSIRIKIQMIYRLHRWSIHSELEEDSWRPCVFVCVCMWASCVCDSFGREGESPWMHLQPPPHPPLRSPAQWLSPFFPTTCVGTKHGWVSNTALRKWTQAAAAAPHPFEIVHVSGLHRSAYECQVVDFCRLLVSLVWLNEQLKGKKQENAFNNSTKTQKKCFSLTVRWFCQRAMCP